VPDVNILEARPHVLDVLRREHHALQTRTALLGGELDCLRAQEGAPAGDIAIAQGKLTEAQTKRDAIRVFLDYVEAMGMAMDMMEK